MARSLGQAEDALVAALQQHVLQWNKRSCLLQPEQHDRSQCRDSKLLYDFVIIEGARRRRAPAFGGPAFWGLPFRRGWGWLAAADARVRA
jgi:hypothetical protein